MENDYNPDSSENPAISLQKQISEINIAKKLDKEKLQKIGADAKVGFDADEQSRKNWMDETKEWMKLAKQMKEEKTFPWPKASNIKYPLISVAAIQFNARAYPSLIPSDGNIVTTRIIGKDVDGQKAAKGERVSKYMSWQLLYDIPNWEEEMDKLLIMLPCCGVMFKKTYYDPVTEKPCSELLSPEDFVVDYYAKTLETAERYSEIIWMNKRRLKERQASGEFIDPDLGDPPAPATDKKNPATVTTDPTTPYKLIQQATWLDLDDDGIAEPYTVIFHYETAKVLKIMARFTPKDIKTDKKGKIVSIKDQCYYTKFGFIPNPDGSFYDVGFGHLLGPINESVNTNINQLTDAGTLANLQAGFVGKGLKMKMGDTPLGPGEWRAVNAVGDDLRKMMVPLPTKEPSEVLFKLLGMLVQAGKELASVAEIFVGKMPGQNTPATTTMETVRQGMAVFTAIYKRIYKALDKEFKKLFYINGQYLDPKTYVTVLDEPISPDDFDMDLYDLCPGADPAASSQTEKQLKAQALLDLMPLGTIDPVEVTMRILQAQEQPNWERLIPGMEQTGQPQIPPKQDPKMMEMQAKMEAEQQKAALKQQEMQQKMAMNQRESEFELAMKAQEHQMTIQQKAEEGALDAQIAEHKQKIFMAEGANKLAVNEALGTQKVQHTKEMNKLQQSSKQTSGQTGKTTQSRGGSSKRSPRGKMR